jgi:hypothetical protein
MTWCPPPTIIVSGNQNLVLSEITCFLILSDMWFSTVQQQDICFSLKCTNFLHMSSVIAHTLLTLVVHLQQIQIYSCRPTHFSLQFVKCPPYWTLFQLKVLGFSAMVFFFCSVAYLWECWLHVRFRVFMAVTMKNAVFWDVTLCGSCKNRRFGGT